MSAPLFIAKLGAFADRVAPIVGAWGRPPDVIAKVALAAGGVLVVVALVGRGKGLLGIGAAPLPRRMFLWLTAFAAALLSILYIAEYLRGGPRIIDATTYFLQGRALSEGSLAWPVAEPSASFRGRFLLYRDDGGASVLGGIFPPGFPLLLAFGFALGAPMVTGPVLAAAIVLATYRLARTIAEEHVDSALVEPVARAAALVSVVCAAMRYHTADTMAHGATALGVAIVLDRVIRARRAGTSTSTSRSTSRSSSTGEKGDAGRHAILGGLALGFVAATRPVSALPIAIVVVALLARKRGLLVRAAIAALPGVALLVLAQHAVTGTWFASSQRMYYAQSDGPPGCFRWGFGKGTGCLVEHAEFVKARLPTRYGPVEALLTTLRRLRLHLLDVANAEPLALLLFLPIVRRKTSAVTAAIALVGLQVLAYAPFYFDGNYPGGGARFFADVLPVEHVLLALAIARLATTEKRYVRAAVVFVGLSLAGFGVRAANDHVLLRDRDGGRPMFEADVIAKANVSTALVFVETDHGFALGHDPAASPRSGVLVARLRNDDRDRLLFDRLDRPPTYLYRFDMGVAGHTPAEPVLLPWSPPISAETLRFEAEAEWPPVDQHGGFAEAVQADACASQSRALALVPWPPEGDAEASIRVPVPESGKWVVGLRVLRSPKIPGLDDLPTAKRAEARIGDVVYTWIPAGTGCADVATHDLLLTAPFTTLVLSAHGGPIALDKLSLRRLK